MSAKLQHILKGDMLASVSDFTLSIDSVSSVEKYVLY